MSERFQIIHLGNPYDFVVKDKESNRTYGTFQGDSESLLDCLSRLEDEILDLREELRLALN